MSVIHKFIGRQGKFQWENVQGKKLKMEGLRSATKHILIGKKEKAPTSIMRFFQIEPGGHSILERHPHEHEVLILEGKGKIQIGNDIFEVQPYDAALIDGNELHQFSNPYDEPFGFICVIPK